MDIVFFPEIGGSYAIRNSAVEYHSDDAGDPWAIFGPKGGHMATFCMRKSRIQLWPFELDDDKVKWEKRPRFTDKNLSLKNAVAYAMLKWPHIRKSNVNDNSFKNTVVKRVKGDMFYVPYNIDRDILGTNGSYVICNKYGKVCGKVYKDLFEIGSNKDDLYRGDYKLAGKWNEALESRDGSREVLRKLLHHINDVISLNDAYQDSDGVMKFIKQY